MRDVENFIDSLPKGERVILKWLREKIISADERISEKLSYGVPYFIRNRRLFFLWPASAIPRHYEKQDGAPRVTFGFCYGNLLSNAQGCWLMKTGNRFLPFRFIALRTFLSNLYGKL